MRSVNSSTATPTSDASVEKVDWIKSIPFLLVHVLAIGLPFLPGIGISWELVALAVGAYYGRMFFVTAGYHRYFSHRAFKTSRVMQFLFAFFAEMTSQKGVLWWASHHRHHHRESDQEGDVHSPTLKGFWWSHVGWILCNKYENARYDSIRDFTRFPELMFLDKFHYLPLAIGVGSLYAIGGFPYVVWGGLVSTVLLWHGTFTINSLSHVFGNRRYVTTDTSRNNALLAVLTMGEGWHNNHHYHQNTANQGWFWWEIDMTYYVLRVMSVLGLVWDLRTASDATRYAYKKYTPEQKAQLKIEGGYNVGRTVSPAPAAAAKPIPTPEAVEVPVLAALVVPAPLPTLEQ